jgi:hypothetical protein
MGLFERAKHVEMAKSSKPSHHIDKESHKHPTRSEKPYHKTHVAGEEHKPVTNATSTELASRIIETELDKIYKIVSHVGAASVDELSAAIGMPMQRVEQWAQVLDREGLLKIEYPILGQLKLCKPKYKKKGKKKHEHKARNLLIFSVVVESIIILALVLLNKGVIQFQ